MIYLGLFHAMFFSTSWNFQPLWGSWHLMHICILDNCSHVSPLGISRNHSFALDIYIQIYGYIYDLELMHFWKPWRMQSLCTLSSYQKNPPDPSENCGFGTGRFYWNIISNLHTVTAISVNISFLLFKTSVRVMSDIRTCSIFFLYEFLIVFKLF